MGEMVALAVRLARRIWRDGFRYAKAGVMITELLPTVRRAGRRAGDELPGVRSR